MAREMYLVGVDKEELKPDPKPEGPRTPREKWDNFWYHYKWWVVAGGFVLLLIIVSVWQISGTVDADYAVTLVTKDTMSTDAIVSLTAELQKYGVDVNGDGQVRVNVENLVLGQSVGGSSAPMESTNNQKLTAYLMAGEVMIYVFDKTCYDARVDALTDGQPFFEPFPDTLDGVNAELGCWDWNGSSYQTSLWGKQMPETLYFGVRRIGGTASDETSRQNHDAGMELLTRFIEAAN